MKNNENDKLNKKILVIVLWIVLSILSNNGNLIFLFTYKIDRLINNIFNNIMTYDIKIIINSFVNYLAYILIIIPILVIIANLYFKITTMKWINVIVGALYALIYLVNFIYVTQVFIPVEMLFYFIGLLITILIIIESMKMIIQFYFSSHKNSPV
jgi:hypothetical protein